VDLTGYTDLLRRRWRIAALIVLLSVGVALVVTQLQQRRYQSTVGMVVSGSSPTTSGETAGRDLAAARAAAFAQLVATDAVLPSAEQAAGEELGKPVAKADIGVHASSSGALLTVRVTADDPDAALAVARAMPLVLPGQLAKLNQLPAVSGGPLLTVVTPATRASHPSAPHPLRNLLIGLAAGALLAAAVPLIRVRATGARGVRDSTEIAGLARGNVLGVVPREFEADRLAVASRPRSPRSAAYRDIQAKLAGADQQLGSFVVTSAERGAGRSTVTANLAVLFGRTGRRVAVIDADLREPTLASIFNLASESGLSDVVTGHGVLPDLLQEIARHKVTVLAGGRELADPNELAALPAMAEVLRTLSAQFDVVLVDGPPASDGPAALQLGVLTDGVLVVARPDGTNRKQLRRTLGAIGRAPVRMLGVVINAADQEIETGSVAGPDVDPPLDPAPALPTAVDRPMPGRALEQPHPTYAPERARRRRR
jgi:polysaccharide biosynthesis transport protein